MSPSELPELGAPSPAARALPPSTTGPAQDAFQISSFIWGIQLVLTAVFVLVFWNHASDTRDEGARVFSYIFMGIGGLSALLFWQYRLRQNWARLIAIVGSVLGALRSLSAVVRDSGSFGLEGFDKFMGVVGIVLQVLFIVFAVRAAKEFHE